MTSYGREVSYGLACELAEAGALIVSGMAFGIDACAHRAALDADQPTIAVLGCGADIAYPAAHRSLWRRIAEHGLVLSEVMPRDVPWWWTFPARNRIVAGLAGVTIVVEAAARPGLDAVRGSEAGGTASCCGAFTGALHHHRLNRATRVIHPGKEAAHGRTGPKDVRLARRLRRTNRREHRLDRCGRLR
jgi:DNA protecting protein DprA